MAAALSLGPVLAAFLLLLAPGDAGARGQDDPSLQALRAIRPLAAQPLAATGSPGWLSQARDRVVGFVPGQLPGLHRPALPARRSALCVCRPLTPWAPQPPRLSLLRGAGAKLVCHAAPEDTQGEGSEASGEEIDGDSEDIDGASFDSGADGVTAEEPTEKDGRGAREIADADGNDEWWGRLSSDQLQREVEDLYPKNVDMSQSDLLRARAEIAREELTTEAEKASFDLDSEVDKLIAFQRQATLSSDSRAAAAARRKTTGIPGEVVEGGPEYPELADFETAHELHATLAKRPWIDVLKLEKTFPDIAEHERFKVYVSPANVSRFLDAGLLSEKSGAVARAMEPAVLEVMNAAVKLAQQDLPGLTAPGMCEGGGECVSVCLSACLSVCLSICLSFPHGVSGFLPPFRPRAGSASAHRVLEGARGPLSVLPPTAALPLA